MADGPAPSQVKDNTDHIGDYDSLQLRNIVARHVTNHDGMQPSRRVFLTLFQGFFIFIGVVWLLTSITVIYGVRKRSQAAICCFVISLLLMFVVEIAVGIAAAVVLKVQLRSSLQFAYIPTRAAERSCGRVLATPQHQFHLDAEPAPRPQKSFRR